MKIEATDVGKRYGREWILRGLTYQFETGRRYAVTGPNGAGKSTLLRLLSGYLTPSRGRLSFQEESKKIPVSEVYRSLAFAAPYIQLIEEFTLTEAVRFHARFKPFYEGLNPEEVIAVAALERARHQYIRDFSSGMKQRLKLALAGCSHTPLLLLDEPTTNLDTAGVDWYHRLLDRFAADRLVIIASNAAQDFHHCTERLDILQYK